MRFAFFSLFLLFCLSFSLLSGQGIAPEEGVSKKTRILLIFDASNSMNARWQSDSKISISKRLTMSILDSLTDIPNLELALRVYGHQSPYPPLDCSDSKLEVPFAKANGKKIIHKIKTLVPRGATPIAYSLEQAANDFPPCEDCRNIIILITDGVEECSGDACAASVFLQSKGISLKPFIIGIGKDFRHDFECVGHYFDASTEEDFTEAFHIVISQALNSTTAQVNLLDVRGEPTETNVNMTFYDRASGKQMYNYVHTLNYRGIPDTLTLDPLIVYDVVVHTYPPLRKDSVLVKTGIHNYIAMDLARGGLQLKMTGSRAFLAKSLPCLVRKKGESEVINMQYVNEKDLYLAGNYDLEVLSLPRFKIQDLRVDAHKTTQVEIPMPGILVFQRTVEGFGSLYVEENGIKSLIYNFNENTKTETLYLMPGKYSVVNRSKFQNRAAATKMRNFSIEPGQTVNINL